MTSKLGIGIDVSKAALDVAASDGSISTRHPNSLAGLEALAAELEGRQIHRVVLEASGGYEGRALACLHEAGLPVVLVQPMRARYFARALGRYAKTDAIDAFMLSRMAELAVEDVPLWEPAQETLADLKALLERRRAVQSVRDAEKKRLRLARDVVRPHIEAVIQVLSGQIRELETLIEETIESSTRLRREIAVLVQVSGIGLISAATLRATLPELGTLTRRQIAALAGVAPMNRDSGAWSGQRFIRGGRRDARKSLYMAALAATRWNPVIEARYRTLIGKGKPPKVALVACMRKLLIHLNSRMRSHLDGPTSPALTTT